MMFSELEDACLKVLNEEKNAKRRYVLTTVLKDLELVISTSKKLNNSKKNVKTELSSQTVDQFTGLELGENELNRLGFACRLALLGNSGSRFSSKSLIASLEFSTILLNSGIIPIGFKAKPPEINIPENISGGSGEFFSKLLGGGSSGTRSLLNLNSTENISTQSESKEEIINVFISIVEEILNIAQNIQGKEVNEKILFNLVTALQASAVPRCARILISEKIQCDFNDYFLAIQGDILLRVVENLFLILKKSNIILPLIEETRSALNYIAKALSKAVEHEANEKNEKEINKDNFPIRKFQDDAAKLLEYCCSLTRSSILPSTTQNFQGNSIGIISSPNESSVILLTALSLILHLIVNGGPIFRNSTPIISSLKLSVIPSALSTALLKDIDAFRLSVNVLLTSSISFGHLLVNETETIFRHLFFRVLESKTSSLNQKSLVVEAFRRYIEEPQNLIAIFLNYDCNTRSQSVYEQMIGYLVALSIPNNLRNIIDIKDRNDSFSEKIILDFQVPESLQRSALTTLLLVPYSNLQWIERFECDQNLSFENENRSNNIKTNSDLLNDFDKRIESQRDLTISNKIENENDQFIQALRTKDAFKKFLYYMNEAKDPQTAIDFIFKEPLLLPIKNYKNIEKVLISPSETTIEDINYKYEAIASFLKEKEDYIDKLVLGEYFAKSFRKPQTRIIFVKWIEQHSFTGMTLDAALRLFLGGFKLLGEAEVVDKTMELFAAQYCKENPTAFRSANTAFILSFSICMLNTDAHSPHVKNKMTLDAFIKNNKGIDEGSDVDSVLLKGIYERIVSNEIKLRPSKFISNNLNINENNNNNSRGQSTLNNKISSGLLESIPLLKHFAPVARAITDTVMIPLDVAGNVLFNTLQRKQEEIYQAELRLALKDVFEALETSNALKSSFVEATRIENAIPMWAITVDNLVKTLLYAFDNFFTTAELNPTPSQNTQGYVDFTYLFLNSQQNRDYFDILLKGVVNTVRVCCNFGNVSHAEDLIEKLFQLTQFENIINISQKSKNCVSISNGISKPRIELLATLLNLFLSNGSSLTMRGWRVAYTGISLLDLISNGIEGIWKRQRRKSIVGDISYHTHPSSTSTSSSPPPPLFLPPPPPPPPPPDTWFGNLEDIPPSFDKNSVKMRNLILDGLRSFSSVDLWLERLFDATEYPSQTQVFMSNAMVSVCEKELNSLRSFTLFKLFDFLTVCASISSRMQWRDLWTNASKVFILAGTMNFDISSSALKGLRIIALNYLMREELLNYSFQKEVLMPFEAILMGNQDVKIRQMIIQIIAELIDFRDSHLASGWNVVFSILSHSAVIPEIVKSAWDVCEHIITLHVSLMKDCFRDLVFCLTSFACNNVDEEIALLSISYLKVCGHWLQFGLESPPTDVRDSTAVSEWASRYKDADSEAHAAQLNNRIPKVTLSTIPITSIRNLEKPTSLSIKTNYHLWMSLLEGMIPIILVHPSVRVRAHIICSLWSLIGHYAIAFATDIQESLFKGILRPVIFSLIMHVPNEQEISFDNTDYKLLTFLILKSMFLACSKHPNLLNFACETFKGICMTTMSIELVQAGFVDVILRICIDIEPSGNIINYNSEIKNSKLWVSRLLHELNHIGYIDIIHFKKTAGWFELHHSTAVRELIVNIDPNLGDKGYNLVFNTILTCISNGIITQLFSTMNLCSLQEDFFLFSREIRRSYLVLALLCSSDSTEKVFPIFISGISATLTIPEQQLIPPYLFILIEFIFFLRSKPPTVKEIETLRRAISEIYQTIEQSRNFCISHQTEFINNFNKEKLDGDSSFIIKKYKGKSFIDIFRSGRVPLNYSSKNIFRTNPERFVNEWKYLTHILGLKFIFMLNRFIVQCMSSETLYRLILLFPSELEEELIEPFLTSCWEELEVGNNIMEKSTISLALSVLEKKEQACDNIASKIMI